jgi:hypothetical protein
MSIFSRKSKSDAAWDKLQNLWLKYLEKPDVDWSDKLSDKIKYLGPADRSAFLINHGRDFFTLLESALSHDQRRLRHPRSLIVRFISVSDLPSIEDQDLRENLLNRYMNIGCGLDERMDDYGPYSECKNLLHEHNKNEGFLNDDQLERVVLRAAAFTYDHDKEGGGYSRFFHSWFESSIEESNIKQSTALSKALWDNMAERPELMSTDLFYKFTSTILPKLHDDIYQEACIVLRERLDSEANSIIENADGAVAEIAKKAKALNDLDVTGAYKNINIGEAVVVKYQGKENYIASVVSFNNVSSGHIDEVVFTENGGEGSASVTSDIRQTLVDQFDTAGSQLADKLDAQSALKPKKTTALLIQ